MKSLCLFLSSAALCSLFTGVNPAFAQGTAFTYQGRLNDGASPANGSYDLTFALFDADTLGMQKGNTLTNAATTVSNGLFTVTLDFGNQFTGADRWLEIGVATNGSGVFTNLSPRQFIASTPYAIQAANAASAASVNAANVTGMLELAQLPTTVVTNGASGVNISGTFTGDGGSITNVNFSTINSDGLLTWGSFTLSSSPPGGPYPASVIAADVNEDGSLDLISADSAAGSILVLTNDGGGGFGLSSSPTVGLNPVSVTAADVNGDGHVDLISANYDSDTLSVLTNDGSGNFGLLTSPAAENGPYFVTVADINEDGRPDLITANYDTNTLSVLTNDGGGGFGLSSSPTVGLYPVSVTAADVNGDGHVDLISANFGTNTLSVLTNNGSGSFVLSSSPGVGPNPVSVAAADLNGDGRLDLIGADQSSASLSVLTNDGSGGFGLSSSPGVGFSPTDVKAADLNGDGHLDLVTANQGASSLSVLTNDGTGGFVLSSSPPVGGSPVSVTAADVNGDGRLDLISANRFNLSVLFNTPTFNGSFRGDGSGLTSLNASQLNSGTVADARLSANVSLLGASIDSSEITDGTIVNADINAAAGIVDTKLATISTAGKVADSALSANVTKLGSTIESSEITDGTIVDADINAAAAIADTKLATIATAGKVADSALSANVTKLGSTIESSEITDGTIVDADINAAAAIADTKLATISTAGKVADTALSANVALRSGGNAFTGLQTVTGGNVGIGTNNPGLNNLQINPTFHYANGYGLEVNKTDFGANIQVNRTAGQVGIGLVVDDSSAGDGSTSLLEVRNNVATSPQTLLNVAASGDTFVNGSLNLNTGTYPGVTAFIRARPGDSLPLAVQGTNGVNFVLVNTNGRVDISGDCYAQSFTPLSDRKAKENFRLVSPEQVLAKVAALPIQEWNFKTDAGTTHIGPMAQDFYAAFGVGHDDKHIATVDADGVALAAIQGLNQKLEQKETEITELKTRLEKLEQLLEHRLNGGAK